MNTWTSLILGFVEGMTEFLPVSSTGHLILASNALGLENSEFLKLFEIVIQTGAIAAVIFIYWKDLLKDKSYLFKIGLAFLPTGILGLLVHGMVKKYLFTPMVVCSALFFGGIVLLFLENLTSKIKRREFSTSHYLLLGCFQCLAFSVWLSVSGLHSWSFKIGGNDIRRKATWWNQRRGSKIFSSPSDTNDPFRFGLFTYQSELYIDPT